MKQLLTVLGFFSTTFLFIACNSKTASESNTATETKPAFDLAAAKKTIDSINAEFGSLVAKGDSAGIANLYHSEAKLMGSNMPAVSGKAGITSAFAGMLSMGIGSATLTTNEVYGNEDIVSEVGVYSMSDKAGKEIDRGKYIVLWKKENSQWKLFRDCFNSDNPAQAAH